MDLITYALCKKLVSKAATGIQKIETDENGDLIFTMADGSTIKVDLPIKTDCVDFEFVSALPISGMEPNKVYVQKTALSDENGESIYRQYMWVDERWKFIGKSGQPIATTENVGLVKPDGESIIIDETGTIAVDVDYVYEKIEDIIQEGEGLVGDMDIDDLFK